MEQTATVLETILRKYKDINLVRKKVVAEEQDDPERTVSGWGDLEITPLQLFMEYAVTNGLGCHDSFYWNPPNQLLSEYEKLKNTLRIAELQDEWSEIDCNYLLIFQQ